MWVTVSRGRIRASPQLATRNFGSQTERCYKSVLASWGPLDSAQPAAASRAVNSARKQIAVALTFAAKWESTATCGPSSPFTLVSRTRGSRVISELFPNVARDERRQKLPGIGKEHSRVAGKRSVRLVCPFREPTRGGSAFARCRINRGLYWTDDARRDKIFLKLAVRFSSAYRSGGTAPSLRVSRADRRLRYDETGPEERIRNGRRSFRKSKCREKCTF